MAYLEHHVQFDFDDDDDEGGTSAAQKLAEDYFNNSSQERWTLRRKTNDDEKIPATKKQKMISSFGVLEGGSSDVLLTIASFLDPHDIMDFLCISRATSSLSQIEAIWTIRLESVLGYFRFSQKYVDQLTKMKYDWKHLIKFFTHLAVTMQRIYGQSYDVHPIHRFLVAQRILGELCSAILKTTTMTRDSPTDLLHTMAPRVKLTEKFFFTYFARFCWSVVMGDGYYSFERSGCKEYGHGEMDVDFDAKQNVLETAGVVYVYMYQDEDNFMLGGMTKRPVQEDDNSDAAPGLLYMQGMPDYKGLAHYFVLAQRRCWCDPPGPIEAETIVERLKLLRNHKLLEDETRLDWNSPALAVDVGVGTLADPRGIKL